MTLSCMCKRNRRRMNSSNSCCNRNPSTRIDGRFTSFFLASTIILCYSLSLTKTMTMTRVDAFIPIPTIPRTTTAITKDLMQSRHWAATATAVSTSLSLSLSSSLNDDDHDDHEYFFTAPDLTAEETIDHTKTKTKTTTHTTDTKIDLATIASREKNELESMIVNDKEHIQQQEPQREEEEGGQTMTTAMATTSTRNVDAVPITTAIKAAATTATTPAPSSVSNSIPNSMSISMDVDGNGTGGLMKRSHTGGGTGTDATLMVTSMKTLAFPIDSGKDGMEANDTKRRTRTRTTQTTTQTTHTASDGTGTGTGMRLVRYTSNNSNSNSNGPSSKSKSLVASAATMSKTTTTTKKLVLAPAGTTTRRGTTGTGTHHHGTTGGGGGGSAIITKAKNKNTVTNGIVTNSNSRLVRYNGPDLDDTTDYDGMETVSTRNQRQQEIQLSDSKLVMYNPTTPTTPTTPTPDNNYNKSNNNIDPTNNNNKKKKNDEKQQKQKQKHHRPTLTQDIKYSIQYIEKTDFTMARKTGLAVNKPISLWIERDTFL